MIDSETQAYIKRIIDIKIQEHEAKKDPIEEFNKLLENPRVQDVFNRMIDSRVKEELERAKDGIKEIVKEELDTSFDNRLITSELEVLPRLRSVEKVTGIYQFEEWEEHPATLPEQIQALSERTVLAPEKPTEEQKEDNPLIANTTLTKKASALTDYLKNKKASWSGKIVVESEEIYTFFREKIQEDLRWPQDLKGYRGAKKDIIQRAKELYPDQVEIVKNKSGNKITGLALKPSANRRDTYGC